MECYVGILVAFLLGLIIGRCLPQLCPHCKIEKQWIDKTIKEMHKKIGKPDA